MTPSCQTSERSPQPRFEVADIIRQAVDDGFADGLLPPEHAKVLRAICRCRTAELGGHAHVCFDCGHLDIAYNSCRNRHCPRCQWAAQEAWIAGQMERVLDTQYFHVVFTLPSELRDLATANPREVYGLLMRTAARTLIELGRDPQWLGAEVGITSVLHTWTRNLRLHPHVHCLVTGGGIDDEGCWRDAGSSFLAPVKVMGALFRGKFLAGLRSLRRRDKLSLEGRAEALAEPGAFETLVGRLYDKSWVVYAKRQMAGPEQVIAYLGRYTHRVAVSNNRILDVSEGHVTFRTRRDKTAKLSADQFVRRFLLHVLPKSFTKIRHYGILASPNLATLWVAAHLALGAVQTQEQGHAEGPADTDESPACPACGSNRITTVRLDRDAIVALESAEARGPPKGHRRGGGS